MENYQSEVCVLVRGSGARVGKLGSVRIRDLWREWSLTEFALPWVAPGREHLRWFLWWAERRPGLSAEAAKTRGRHTGGTCAQTLAMTRVNRPPGGTEVGLQGRVPMMMDGLSSQPQAWHRLTGYKQPQFERILEAFVDEWDETNETRTVQGRQRLKRGRGGRQGAGFGPREALFFILFYYKHYPMQKTMAALFGLSQQWASLWIKHLTPLAEGALGGRVLPPARRPATLEQLLAVEPMVLLIAEPQELTPAQHAGLADLTRLRAVLP